MEIKALKITEENFREFGKAVLTPQGSPTAEAADYRFWSNIADYDINGSTEIGVCTVYKQKINLIREMECHKLTPEILIPIDAPFVLPLIHPNDPLENTRAFIVNLGEAVVIEKGVWHGACLPLDKEEASYFVIFRKGTPSEDVFKKQINETLIKF